MSHKNFKRETKSLLKGAKKAIKTKYNKAKTEKIQQDSKFKVRGDWDDLVRKEILW